MPAKKPRRKKLLATVETAVLAKSARRCTLCFHLKGDLSEKQGQISHLDDDPSNGAEENLAWMCLDHHSTYDSKTKQHKNYTIGEVKAARAKLYDLIAHGKYLTPAAALPYLQAVADKKTLHDFLETVPSNRAIRVLREFDFGAAFRLEWIEDIDVFLQNRNGPDHEFLDAKLEAARQKFRKTCVAFSSAVAAHTFPVGTNGVQSIPRDWEFDNPKRFYEAVEEVNRSADEVWKAYDRLVRLARSKLAV